MTQIILKTAINASQDVVFDLARDIDVHQFTTSKTREKAVGGRTSGRISPGETVTWKGKHFGLWLKHTSRNTAMEIPKSFVDEMERGCFKSFRHEHFFERDGDNCIMIDRLCYETPYGIFGRLFDWLILEKYLTEFLKTRNNAIKKLAEQS
jgi:ligand-binding SRPBCC domain-containing protein